MKSCNIIRLTFVCSEYDFKHDLSQLEKFVYLRSIYSLSVMNLESKLE
jgi:hypothetical protein